MLKNRLSLLFAILIIASMLLAACGAQATEAPAAEAPAAEEEAEAPAAEEEAAPAEEKVLIMAVEGSVPTFDPLGASDSRVDTPSLNIYNALTQVKPGTNDVEMELAESVTPSDDGLTYTFKLREGVLFHDGSEVTADDVVYTVERANALKKGYYHSVAPITSATAVDDYTVELNLSEVFPAILPALTRLYILNADVVSEHHDGEDWGETWLQDHEAGSGPYILDSFEPEQQFTIVKFDDYFKGWEGAHADKVIFQVYKEEATRRLAVENGEVDWAVITSADTFEALKSNDTLKTYADVTLNALYIALNTQNEYLQDAKIRQALALAYDYQGHVEQARNGHADVLAGALPPAIVCFDDSLEKGSQDLEKAKELMAEAGYPDGGFELDMAYQGTADEETKTFQIMQAGAAELGIDIKAMPVEWPTKVDAFSSQETAPAMGTIWMYPSYPDPNEFLFQLGHSGQAGSGYNFAWFQNDEFDELVDAGRSELDPEKRCELYTEAQKIWVEEAPYINLVVGHALAASQSYVDGYVWTPSHSFAQNVYIMSVEGK